MKNIWIVLSIMLFLIFSTYIEPVSAANLTIDDGLVVAEGLTKADAISGWNQVLKQYRLFVIGFFAIATLSMAGLFVFSFMQLGASAGNPQARAKAVTGVLWTGISTAVLGATLFFFGMFYTMI